MLLQLLQQRSSPPPPRLASPREVLGLSDDEGFVQLR
jgi:hypothetical protein